MTTVRDAIGAAKRRANESKPGSTIWIETSRIRAAEKAIRIEESVPGAKGLYLVTQPSGARSWAFRYRRPGTGKAAKLTIGGVDLTRELETGEEPAFGEPLTKDMAVALAAQCHLKVRQKADPATLLRQQATTLAAAQNERWEGHLLDDLFVRFMQTYPLIRGKREARESSKRQTALFLGLKPDGKDGWQPTGNGVLSKWTGKVFSRRDGSPVITRKDAFGILDNMKPVTANRTLTALKLFGRWAEEREYVSVNPFATMRKQHEETERERILNPDEIRALWQAVETAKESEAIGYPYGRIAHLVLITGQRPGEVREAAWSEFDFGEREWTIPAHRAKNGKPHVVPLSQLALQILATVPDRGRFLFMAKGSSAPVHKQSRVKERLDTRVAEKLARPLPHWTYHDLRHTAYSGITALGLTYIVADKVVNHAPPAMAKVYDQYDYYGEKWAALDAWAGRLVEITKESTVPGSG